MQRQTVYSTNLRSVGYDEVSATLEIEFRSGGTYAYQRVPRERYLGLMEAGSKGRYFRHNIKHSYSWSRV